MQTFAQGRLQWFQGRERELGQLREFARSDGDARLCVVAGAPGQGKSALLARFIDELDDKDYVLMKHFVGATEDSGDVRNLLLRLYTWLNREGVGGRLSEEQYSDLRKLTGSFAARIRGGFGGRRVILVIDALNQLVGGHDLGWLPTDLGPDLRVIVSCVDDPSAARTSPEAQVLQALDGRRAGSVRINLAGLSECEVKHIVSTYFADFGKRLEADKIDLVGKVRQAGSPLYLRVMLDQIRILGGEDVDQKVPLLLNDMGEVRPDVVSMFDWVLQGLEEGFGRDLVQAWATYLHLGRVGMASIELAELLEHRFDIAGRDQARFVERGFRPYLQRRGSQIDFFHSQLGVAVARRYLDAHLKTRHGEIAAVLDRRSRLSPPDRHAVSELLYHLVTAQSWDTALSLLGDWDYLDCKASIQDPETVANDFAMAFSMANRQAPERAASIVDTLDRLFKGTPADSSGWLTLENLNAWLQYTSDGAPLLEALLRRAATDDQGSSDRDHAHILTCRVHLAELLRRSTVPEKMEEAFDILDEIDADSASSSELRTLGIAQYQLGYSHHYLGQLDRAVDAMRKSVDLSSRSGDEVGADISRCVLHQFIWFRTQSDATIKNWREVLESAREVFNRHADEDERARRWRIHNVDGQFLKIAFELGDAAEAQRACEAIRQDAWETSTGRNEGALWNDARVAILEERWEDAIEYFETVSLNAQQAWLGLDYATKDDRSEGLSEKYFAYGKALVAVGREGDAQRAWERGLECPDDRGNFLGKAKIKRILGDKQAHNSRVGSP